MLTKRIIGAVLVENGHVVRRVNFKTKSIIGKPEVTFRYLENWNIDELILINVGSKTNLIPLIKQASENCFIPLTIGGSISSASEAVDYIRNGADKVVLGKHANQSICEEIADRLGSQALTVCFETNHANKMIKASTWPIGEVILHDITRDGTGKGLNLDILKLESDVPKIAMGGVGSYEDIVDGLELVDGVAVGNLFHFKEIAAIQAKKEAKNRGLKIR